MYRIILILITVVIMTLITTGCELSDDRPNINYQAVAVDSVLMPDTMQYMQAYSIPVYYTKQTQCHLFDGFNVNAQLNERIITPILSVIDTGNCALDQIPTVEHLQFNAVTQGDYVFKFYNGVDDDDNPVYLEYNIVVE